jgi:hypothetical protein
MKNFRKSISSTKRNNLRLFVQLSVVMLFAVVSLLVWRTAAQMQDKNNAESLQVERFSINGTNLQPAILSVNNATDGAVIPTLGNYHRQRFQRRFGGKPDNRRGADYQCASGGNIFGYGKGFQRRRDERSDIYLDGD